MPHNPDVPTDTSLACWLRWRDCTACLPMRDSFVAVLRLVRAAEHLGFNPKQSRDKDIGFVREGQEAEVKVDAFPFTSYGIIDAEILKISNDAIEHEKLGWVFGARVSMAKSALLVEGKEVNLSPGMSVAVEVKTGKRRVIDYFLSPLMRGLDENVRER